LCTCGLFVSTPRAAELARQRVAAEPELQGGAAAMVVVLGQRRGEQGLVEAFAAARVDVAFAAAQALARFRAQQRAPVRGARGCRLAMAGADASPGGARLRPADP